MAGWEKKICHLTLRLSDTERDAIRDTARKQGKSVSEYIRSLHSGAKSEPEREAKRAGPHLRVIHVSEVGPDPLWAGPGALER